MNAQNHNIQNHVHNHVHNYGHCTNCNAPPAGAANNQNIANDAGYAAPINYTQFRYNFPAVNNNNVYRGPLPANCKTVSQMPEPIAPVVNTYTRFGSYPFDSQARNDSLPIIGPVRFTNMDRKNPFWNNYYYRGQIKKGRPHGLGVAVYEDCFRYEGEFVDGSPNVYGRWLRHNGEMYIGEWLNGNYHGTGKFYNDVGALEYNGRWKYDQRIN